MNLAVAYTTFFASAGPLLVPTSRRLLVASVPGLAGTFASVTSDDQDVFSIDITAPLATDAVASVSLAFTCVDGTDPNAASHIVLGPTVTNNGTWCSVELGGLLNQSVYLMDFRVTLASGNKFSVWAHIAVGAAA